MIERRRKWAMTAPASVVGMLLLLRLEIASSSPPQERIAKKTSTIPDWHAPFDRTAIEDATFRGLRGGIVATNLASADTAAGAPAPAPAEERQLYTNYGRCTCDECTDQVWNRMTMGGQTCGERISALQQQQQPQGLTEYDACHRIAATDFATVCGPCNPDTCDGRLVPTTTTTIKGATIVTTTTPPPFHCGCSECTDDVWRQPIVAGEEQSCAAYITWTAEIMGHMDDACTSIAWQYPESECARRCHCQAKCQCDTCTDEVLARSALGPDGVVATCGERIAHLQSFEGGNLTPLAACRRVAGDPREFPDVCGPCNPDLCQNLHSNIIIKQGQGIDTNLDMPSMPTILIPTPGFPALPPPTPTLPTPRPPPVLVRTTTRSPPVPPPPTPPVAACGCASCTAEVLNRLTTSADGITASCMARMTYVQSPENNNLSEPDACVLVARDEFPTVCGPCDPTRCNKNDTTEDSVPGGDVDGGDGVITFLERIPPTLPPNDDTDGPTTTASSPFGRNVIIFNPTTPTAEIQQTFDAIHSRQVNNEMGSERYALYFLPGVYGSPEQPLALQIGYYTDVAGLGASPTDVIIHGKIEVYNRCFAGHPYTAGQFIPTSREAGGVCFALNNFWRSLSNLSIRIAHPAGTDPCRSQAMFWAISQASSMRRVVISGGDLSLMDFCAHIDGVDGFASGGFIADSRHSGGTINNGSQQQFLTRNMDIDLWEGAVWNAVFIGVNGAPVDNAATFPDPPVTTIARTPVSREKPHLFVENGSIYMVHKPSARFESSGTSWNVDGSSTGGATTIPLNDFYIAVPGASAADMNAALVAGRHLLLTPGLYEVYDTIHVTRSDTVVMGLGHATVRPMNGVIAIKIASGVQGVVVSGITLDAGPELSPVLLQVGGRNILDHGGDRANPITLSDIYFRVGGPYIGKTAICLEINSNHVLIDHTWVWRADHGIEPFDKTDGFDGDNERWSTNIGTVGVVVNGHDVTATGLFVEHFQQHNLIWNGERGQVLFFQNELPYDPPSQAAWDEGSPTMGWAGYKVNDNVNVHELWAAGVYCYNRNDPTIETATGFEAPTYKAGVQLNRLYTINLSGPGTIQTVLNRSIGGAVSTANRGPEYVSGP